MKRLLPQPLLSLTLLLTWLLATRINPGQLLLGTVLALLIPWFSRRFWPHRVHVNQPILLARFAARVVLDIVIASIAVARLILGPVQAIHPAFIRYPLLLHDEFAITVLANTISLTPGTVSANLSEDHGTLLIHALNVDDQQALIETIHARYERPLQEIFESC